MANHWMLEALEAFNDVADALGAPVEKRRDEVVERISDWVGDLVEWIAVDAGEQRTSAEEAASAGGKGAAIEAGVAAIAGALGETGEQLGLAPRAAVLEADARIALQPPAEVTLQRGDNDQYRKWGGTTHLVEGDHVTRLQQRLVELGYWVSGHENGYGMKCDGDYGVSTTGAVATFQLENLAVDGEGNIDESKVTGNCDADTLAAINAADGRPSHIAKSATRAATTSPKVEPSPFVQLPPSEDFLRYSPNYDDGGAIPLLSTKHFRIMSDNWGQPALVEMIQKVAGEWREAGMERLLVGDLSRFSGGKMPSHQSHQFGMGVDIDHNRYCSVNREPFEVENALKLAKLFEKHGATVVYFNCHHVIENCDIAKYAGSHHHHFHVDREFGHHDRTRTTCQHCLKFPGCPRRILKVTKKGTSHSETDYLPETHGVVGRGARVVNNGQWYVSETAGG